MNPLAVALGQVHTARSRSAGRLTVTPLVAIARHVPAYLLLDEALTAGLVSITELSGDASVSDIRFENRATTPVLVIDGEALIGAKQNRIANITILVPPRTVTIIPVSCVERGRWAYRQRDFKAADHVLYAGSRARKARDVSDALRSSGEARAKQSEIWSDIASKASRMSVSSPSEAMDALFAAAGGVLNDVAESVGPQEGETGAVFAIDGHVLGLELFDATTTWRRFAPKVIRSYAIEALDHDTCAPGSEGSEEVWIRDLAASSIGEFPSVGLGQDIRIDHPHIAGGALVFGQTLIHLAAFAVGGRR